MIGPVQQLDGVATGRLERRPGWLRAGLGVPLLRDGYALILNSGLTSAMGLVYWLIAARVYSAHAVGVNAAAISAMMFLAGVAQLNLMSALLRFVPVSGPRARTLVLWCYGIALGLGAAVGLLFAAGAPSWASGLSFLAQPGFLVWFAAATMTWCVFNLQDSVLTAVGRAVFVPLENQLFSMAKIVLLVALATVSPRYGIFASWTAGLLFSIVPVNILIFRRLLPAHGRDRAADVGAPTRDEVSRYVSADFVASLCWLAATALMPVIVLAVKGATENAFFALAWMIVLPLFSISASTGAVLVAAGAREPERLEHYVRQVLGQTLRLVVPLALLLALSAPLVLRVFGSDYADQAATTLRLLSLAAIPNVLVVLAVSAARVRRRMRVVVALLASQCALVISLSLVSLHFGGVAGVGLAWLVANTIVAAVVLGRSIRHARGTPLTSLLRDLAADLGALSWLGWLRSTPLHRRRGRIAAELAPAILATVSQDHDGAARWEIHRSLRTVSDMAVATVGPRDAPPRAIVKLATSPEAARSLTRECEGLAALSADERLASWRALLPRVLARGDHGGAPYVVEALLPGVVATRALTTEESWAALQRDAVQAIGRLHRSTARCVQIGEGNARRWIDDPLRALRRDGIRPGGDGAVDVALEDLAAELRAALLHHRLAVSWVHGDFVPQNILVRIDEAGVRVTGIVDWELARPADLPAIDVVTLLLASRMHASRRELGHVVRGWLAGQGWTTHEQRLLDEAGARLPGDVVDGRALVLLCWLGHVAANLTKSPGYRTHELWRRGNIQVVADALVRG